MSALLYKNEITFLDTDSASTDIVMNLLSHNSWVTFVGDNEATTQITGIFGSDTSPGVSRVCQAIAVASNLPLNTTVDIKLFNGGNADPGDLVHTSPTKKLMNPIGPEGIFNPNQLDSDGYLIDEQRQWNVFVYYLSTPTVISELQLDFTYPNATAIDPVFRYVYAGPIFRTRHPLDKKFSPIASDFSINSVTSSGNISTKRRAPKYQMDVTWPRVDATERLILEQARMYSAGRSVILDAYEAETYKGQFDKIWGRFIEPIELERLTNRQAEAYTAAGLITEH